MDKIGSVKESQSQDGTNVIVYGAFNVESGDEIEIFKVRKFPDALNATSLRNISKRILKNPLDIQLFVCS